MKLIDFTGSTANGEWLEKNARQAQVYTEKAGVNQIVVDSAADIKGVARNVAFSLALYTGQMCTAPQNIYVPRDGIDTAEGHLSFDQVAQALAESVQKLVGDPARAVEILGAVVNDGVAQRIDAARALGPVLLDSQTLAHPQFPQGNDTHAAPGQAGREGRRQVSQGMVRARSALSSPPTARRRASTSRGARSGITAR